MIFLEYPHVIRNLLKTSVRCFTTPGEDVSLLVWLAAQVPGNILEIGTNRGATTREFALAFPHKTIYTVDYPGETPTMMKEQMGELLPADKVGELARSFPNVKQFLENSQTFDYRNRGIGFIYIDGDHSARGIALDTENALNYTHDLNEPWIIAWHDYRIEQRGCWSTIKGFLDDLPLPLATVHGTSVAFVGNIWSGLL